MRSARHPRHAAPKARPRRARAAGRRARAFTAASLVLALVGALTLSAKALSPSPSSRGTPTAAWLGAWAQGDSGTLASHQAATLRLEAAIGRKLAIGHSFAPWGHSLGGLPAWHVAQGRTPLITFGSGADSRQVSAGVHDGYLASLARSIRALGRPVLLRYAWGMDGGVRRGDIASGLAYVAAWRHVHGLFAASGVHASWVWAPSAEAFVGARDRVARYWPGDRYVDWIGAGGYNWGTCDGHSRWADFGTIFGSFYAWGSARGKPLMISETGTVEDPFDPARKAAWYLDAAHTLAQAMPRIRAVVYFDQSGRCDWRPDTSQQSMQGFTRFARDPFFGPTGGPPPPAPSTTTTPPTTVAATTSSTTTTTGPVATPRACTATVSTGGDLQATIDANPDGAVLCLAAGVHRLASPVSPKPNQQLIGEPGAVLNGSKVINGFHQSGTDFVAPGFLPSSPDRHGECSTPGCTYAQDVFIDGVPLVRVSTIANLGPGKFYEDFSANRIYLRDNPDGRLVEQAYAPALIRSAVGGVVVRGLVIEKAANPAQAGAIDNQAASGTSPGGWLIESNEIRFNHGVGVVADSSTVRGNKIHHNGEMGLGGHGTGSLVESNEIAHNNTAGYHCLWSCGGGKWVLNTKLVIRNNYAHDNRGPGLWTDINNYDVLYENNTVVGNYGYGIIHEISFDAVIRNNVVLDTRSRDPGSSFYGGGQIVVSASPNVEIYGNRVRGADGIGILQQSRPDAPSTLGAHVAHDVDVHDNDITGTGGSMAGLAQDIGDQNLFTSRNNRFVNNQYHLPDPTGRWFAWMDADRTASEWQAFGLS
jgi:Right handed beta helix region